VGSRHHVGLRVTALKIQTRELELKVAAVDVDLVRITARSVPDDRNGVVRIQPQIGKIEVAVRAQRNVQVQTRV